MNLDDKHIQVPRLGQVPTNGNRFQAILDAAKKLHYLQACDRIETYQAVAARRRLAWGHWVG
jgi:hypothetical protein